MYTYLDITEHILHTCVYAYVHIYIYAHTHPSFLLVMSGFIVTLGVTTDENISEYGSETGIPEFTNIVYIMVC